MILGILFAYLSPRHIQGCKMKVPKRIKKVVAVSIAIVLVLVGLYSYIVVEHEIKHQTEGRVYYIKLYSLAYRTNYSDWPTSIEELESRLSGRRKEALRETIELIDPVINPDGNSLNVEYTLKPLHFRVKERINFKPVPKYKMEGFFNDKK